MSMYGAKEALECDFPGCDGQFDQTKNALNYIDLAGTNKVFCREHADRLISEGIELLSLTDFHNKNKEAEKDKWRKQREAAEKDFIYTLKWHQREQKGFTCAEIKTEFEADIMGIVHSAAAKYLLHIARVWWDIGPKTGVKFPVFCVSFKPHEGHDFRVKANVAFGYRITDKKEIEFLDHTWGIPESNSLPVGSKNALKDVLGEWFKKQFDNSVKLSEQLRQRAALARRDKS